MRSRDKMTSREWDKLSDDIQALIKRYQQNQPIALGKLADELNLLVKVSSLSVGTSGEIRPSDNPNKPYIIKVNRHEHKNRQRFTLAHEIAHFLIHRDHIDGGITDNVLYRSRLSNELEAQANKLAADILMPWDIIEVKLEEYKDLSKEEKVEKIADDLGVSTTALSIRLGY